RLHVREVLLALLHDYMAGRAGTASAAVVLEMNVDRQRVVQQGPGIAVVGERILLVVDLDGHVERQERYLVDRHYLSMTSSARPLPRGPLNAPSLLTSARSA